MIAKLSTARICLLLVLLSGLVMPAAAQTTAGIPGPKVTDGERAWQLRTALAPGEDGARDRIEARLHYQQAINDDWRWRIVVQGNDFESGDFEPVFLQAELQWEFDEDPAWNKALRFDGRLTEGDDGASALGLVSENQFALGERTYARVDLFTNLQLGARRANGIGAELRSQFAFKADERTTLVLESFNALGRGKTLGKFDRNGQRIGPGVSYKLGNGVSVFGSVLFGLNDVAADTDLRLWLTKSLN